MGSQRVRSDVRWGREAVFTVSKSEEGKAGGGWGAAPTRCTSETPEMPPYPQVYISTRSASWILDAKALIPMSLHPVKEGRCLPC